MKGYQIDVVKSDVLVEIQTRHFYSIKTKLIDLLKNHSVHLVHPIPRVKWIELIHPVSGQRVSFRKSPRRGRLEHIFLELVRVPQLINSNRLTIEVLITEELEIRRADGLGSWRRKGISIIDRKLMCVLESYIFRNKADYLALVPLEVGDEFTARQLAEHLQIPLPLAYKMTYCLRKMGALTISGKNGKASLYQISRPIDLPTYPTWAANPSRD